VAHLHGRVGADGVGDRNDLAHQSGVAAPVPGWVCPWPEACSWPGVEVAGAGGGRIVTLAVAR